MNSKGQMYSQKVQEHAKKCEWRFDYKVVLDNNRLTKSARTCKKCR